MSVRPVLVAAAVVALSGCTAHSPLSRMGEAGVPVPGSWESTKGGQSGVDTDWVRSFRDSTLTSLVAQSLEANPDLKIAAARVEQARSDIRAAGAQAQPQANLGLTGSRAKRNFIGFPFGAEGGGNAGAATGANAQAGQPAPGAAGGEQILSSMSNAWGLTMDVTWEIDVWGRIRAGQSAAVAAAEAAEADYRAARASLAAQVARGYFIVLEANRQAALARDALKVYQDTERAISDRFRTGQADGGFGLNTQTQSGTIESIAAQLRLARSDVAAAQAALSQRAGLQSEARRALQILLGSYPYKDAAWASRESLPALTKTPPAGLPSELLQRRPDVLAAERRFAAQGQRQKEAFRAVFPRLSLTGSGGASTDSLRKVLNSDFGVWSVGGNLIQPIFTGGQVRAEIERRTSQEKESLASLQKTVLNAFSEVETALENESLLRAREASLREAESLAAEADTEARANYRNGLGDILTVLQTQNRLVQARVQLSAIQRLRLDNRVNLRLALGGDFSL